MASDGVKAWSGLLAANLSLLVVQCLPSYPSVCYAAIAVGFHGIGRCEGVEWLAG